METNIVFHQRKREKTNFTGGGTEGGGLWVRPVAARAETEEKENEQSNFVHKASLTSSGVTAL